MLNAVGREFSVALQNYNTLEIAFPMRWSFRE